VKPNISSVEVHQNWVIRDGNWGLISIIHVNLSHFIMNVNHFEVLCNCIKAHPCMEYAFVNWRDLLTICIWTFCHSQRTFHTLHRGRPAPVASPIFGAYLCCGVTTLQGTNLKLGDILSSRDSPILHHKRNWNSKGNQGQMDVCPSIKLIFGTLFRRSTCGGHRVIHVNCVMVALFILIRSWVRS